jgi:hypothetical protein
LMKYYILAVYFQNKDRSKKYYIMSKRNKQD